MNREKYFEINNVYSDEYHSLPLVVQEIRFKAGGIKTYRILLNGKDEIYTGRIFSDSGKIIMVDSKNYHVSDVVHQQLLLSLR